MVGFASLFLGLLLGAQDVRLSVGEGVARVELRLDGETSAELTRAPWSASVDFGPELTPHELEAVGFDAAGREVARARQMINRPRPLADATLVLAPGAGGRGRVAKLSWQSVVDAEPKSASITFDGQPLSVPDLKSFELPSYVPEQVHFLRAELDFDSNLSAVAEITFGGRHKDEAHAELTAIPILLAKRKKLPKVEAMDGWFLAGEKELRVVAVEEGPAEAVFVMDESARPALDALGAPPTPMTAFRPGLDMRFAATLKKDQRLRFIWPVFSRREHSGFQFDLFPRTEDFTNKNGGLAWLALRLRRPVADGPQRLADATAVAALSAAERDRRRAVVVIVGPTPEDVSRHAVASVLRYCEKLLVPVYVFAVAGAAVPPDWGESRDISTTYKLQDAVSDLAKDLDRQRIVWVEGTRLPHTVSLSAAAIAAGVELAR